MRRKFGCPGGIPAATGAGSAWKLLGPGGGGAQYIPTVSPRDPDSMLVACDMTGAYVTHDGGRSWAQFNLGSRVDSFAFDPSDPGVVYAGGTGLYRSDDAGETWHLLFPAPDESLEELMEGDHADHSYLSRGNWPGGEIQCIRVYGSNGENILIGIHAAGRLLLYFSEDRGAAWRELANTDGRRFHQIYSESVQTGSVRICCFTDREAYSLRTRGEPHGTAIRLPEGDMTIAHAAGGWNPETDSPVFYLIAGSGTQTSLWRSDDRGQTWLPLPVCLGGDAPSAFPPPELTVLAVPEYDARVVYAGVGRQLEYGKDTGAGSIHVCFGVIKSEDCGRTWRWVFKSDYETDPANLETGWAERDYGLPWHMTGPKGVGPIGLGACPSDPDVCLATDLSSSFLTTDGGASWKQVYSMDNPDGTVSSRGLEVTTCYGVHFDPFDQRHIAVSFTDIGMFHSQDSGRSWQHGICGVPVPWGNTCYWFVFDPDVRGRSWSAWGGAHDLPRPKMLRSGSFRRYEGGVCKSEDGMLSWSLSNGGMPGNSVVTHLALDAASSSEARTLYAAVFDRGVYKSTDGGASWVLKSNGVSGNRNAWRLALLPDGTLFLLVARGLRGRETVDGALYRSDDGAEHWERVQLPEGVNAPNDLAFDGADPQTLYLSCWPDETGGSAQGGGLYASRDGGSSWRNIFDGTAHAYASAVHPHNPSVLFLVTFDSAAWYSEDAGATWRQIAGYDFKWGHRPMVDPADDGMLYITTFGSGVWHGPWKQEV